jgi:hypothetical protein
MNLRLGFLVASLCVLLSGCAAHRQSQVQLRSDALQSGGRVGVAMTELPKTNTSWPGAGCLLCLAAASAANSSLTDHVRTLPSDDLKPLRSEMADLLRKKGLEPVIIEDNLKLETLASYSSPGPNVARKDFTPLQQKYQVDKLLVIQIDALGVERTYSSYVPTSDPKAMLRGSGYLVNLKNNTYEWYVPVTVLKSAEGKWDEPPKFPGLTNAYYQAIEIGKDRFLDPLKQ